MKICIYTKTLTQHPDGSIVQMAHEIIHELANHSEVLRLLKNYRAASTSVGNKGNDVNHPGGGAK